MCDDPARKERADASHYTGSNPRAAPGGSPPREAIRRVSSAGHLGGANGMKRAASGEPGSGWSAGGLARGCVSVCAPFVGTQVRTPPSLPGHCLPPWLLPAPHTPPHTPPPPPPPPRAAGHLRRPPSAGNLQTHSRASNGSELFDALLAAATGQEPGVGGAGDYRSHGEPPVTSRHYPTTQVRGRGGGGGRRRGGRAAGCVWGEGARTCRTTTALCTPPTSGDLQLTPPPTHPPTPTHPSTHPHPPTYPPPPTHLPTHPCSWRASAPASGRPPTTRWTRFRTR